MFSLRNFELTLRIIFIRYVAFAVLAMIANLAVQRMVMANGDSKTVFVLAVVAGTLVGLALKFQLDKKWVFCDLSRGVKSHGRKFTLYATTGTATTAIFWGAETAFWQIWQTEAMRELGAIIGLSIGYILKYRLDRRFVFTNANVRVQS